MKNVFIQLIALMIAIFCFISMIAMLFDNPSSNKVLWYLVTGWIAFIIAILTEEDDE